MVNVMLTSSGLPKNMWGEALYSACYILNRIPYKDCDKTPYELWKQREPLLKYFKVWGCLAKVNIPPNKKRKLGIKTIDCVFIGYSLNSTTYRFLVINSEVNEISNNTIMESRDVIFFENVFPLKNKMTKTIYDTSTFGLPSGGNVICDGSSSVFPSSENANKSIQNELRKSKRKRKAKDFGPDFYSFMLEDDPKTFGEAMRSIDAPFWKEAINNEMNSFKEN